MSAPLRRSCVLAAWDARKVARRLDRMGQHLNARRAREIQQFYRQEAKRLRSQA